VPEEADGVVKADAVETANSGTLQLSIILRLSR
jgi:hypothetical protein